MKGTDRNKPCACGSGLKAKRCDCRERAERERRERLNLRVVPADEPLRLHTTAESPAHVAHTRSPLLVAALAAIAAGDLR